jgi:hypothetical protein
MHGKTKPLIAWAIILPGRLVQGNIKNNQLKIL